MARRKIKRAAPKMSQKVKQEQNVKINIKNILPQMEQQRSGDYIMPRKGMPMDNLMMGSQSRLLGPSIQYAVRPAEYLPLPERINSQGQPSYVREAPPRVGRPDLIYTETNPSDIAPSKAPIIALPSKPLVPMKARTPGQIRQDFEKRAREAIYGQAIPPPPVMLPQQDESEAAVALAAAPDDRDILAIQAAMRRSEAAKRAWETRRKSNPMGASAATTGVPNIPRSQTPPDSPVEKEEYVPANPYAQEAGHPMSVKARYGRP
jgi:hypothetical protein